MDVEADAPFHDLSVQEHKVASLVACGLSNPEIAEHLGCSARTVDRHVSNIFARTDLRTRAQLASLVALSDGWCAPVPWIPTLGDKVPTLAVLAGVSGGNHHFPSTLDEPEPGDTITALHSDRGPTPSATSWDVGTAAPGRKVPGGRTGLGFTANEVSAPVLRIGSIVPAGSERSTDARAMIRGEELARGSEVIPVPVGVTGVDILRARVADTDAAAALEELVQQGCSAIVLGNFAPTVALPLLRGTEDLGIPVLHSMVDRRLGEFVGPTRGYDHVFQMCSDETVYVRAFARFVEDLTLEARTQGKPVPRRVALVVRKEESAEVRLTTDRLAESARAQGRDVPEVHILEYEQDEDWAAVALALQQLKPHVLHLGVYTETALVTLLDLLRGSGVECPTYCVWVPGIPGFAKRHPRLSEGLLWTTLVGNTENHLGIRFRRAFEARYSEDPGVGGAAVHFDMVKLLEHAWHEVGFSTVPEDLVADLQSVRFQGVTGSFHFAGGRRRALCYPFDTDDPTIAQPYLTFRIENGQSIKI
ncbi:ABC transporter substrate-binding protein [Brevibacterium litoralis]|uniref:ABC transporter substrate-binding protein n=1 Tax=Brevibacterium litoralis TaxID=3138935 RepID=UPI0032ED1D6A